MASTHAKTLMVATLLLVVAVPAQARRGGPPLYVQMTAYVGEKIATMQPEFVWPAGYHGKTYTLNVIKVSVLNAGKSPLALDAALAPYPVKFQLRGEPTALRRLTTAPPGQQLRIMGFLRLGPGRYLMLDTVETLEVTPASPR